MRAVTAARVYPVLAAVLLLAACTAPNRAPPRKREAIDTGPACKIEGCCEGHGGVAFMQRDLAIICADGSASETCDCHQ